MLRPVFWTRRCSHHAVLLRCGSPLIVVRDGSCNPEPLQHPTGLPGSIHAQESRQWKSKPHIHSGTHGVTRRSRGTRRMACPPDIIARKRLDLKDHGVLRVKGGNGSLHFFGSDRPASLALERLQWMHAGAPPPARPGSLVSAWDGRARRGRHIPRRESCGSSDGDGIFLRRLSQAVRHRGWSVRRGVMCTSLAIRIDTHRLSRMGR
jgi:hypothetical protein